MEKISVVIISSNSQKYLRECFTSVKWADEIILVDNDSTDQTIKIAQDFEAKVYEHHWMGYAKQKNFAISKTKNQWILSIDTDEVLDKKLTAAIKNADYKNSDGFELNRRNLFAGQWVRYCGWYPDWQLRLFKKNKMQYQDQEVHERVQPVGKIGQLKGHLIHYSYVSNQEYFTKLEKYTSLDAEILWQKHKQWSLVYQIFKPIKEFFQKYFSQKGYLNGWLGLKISLFSAYYRWQVAKKLKDLYAHRN